MRSMWSAVRVGVIAGLVASVSLLLGGCASTADSSGSASSGADLIDGGAGSDRYWGNGGADTFVFGVDGAFDKIHNYVDGVDVIDASVQPFASDRSAPGSSQSACTRRAS